MGKATVVVTAIHNRTKETITIPHQQRGPISIEPGGTLEGPFIYTYDPEREGAIPSPNQAWFIDSPHEFKWGTFAFPSPAMALVEQGVDTWFDEWNLLPGDSLVGGIGASAQGNAYRYAYYVCFSRHRYGTQECDQDRLRGDELEDRVVESLLATLAQRELLEEAVERWGEIVESNRPDRERELAAVEAQIRRARGRWIATSKLSRRGGCGRRFAPDASRSSRRNSPRSRPGAPSLLRRFRRVSRVSRTRPSSRSSSGISSAR